MMFQIDFCSVTKNILWVSSHVVDRSQRQCCPRTMVLSTGPRSAEFTSRVRKERVMKKNNILSFLYPWIVWTIGAGFFFYKYLVQVSPSVMTGDLMRTFHIHGAGLGNLSAFYFYAYLLMQIPVGILLDKYSPRLLTATAIFICALGTLAFSYADTLWMACVSRALIGAGAAFAAVSCFKLATIWFEPKRFAMISGMCMTAAMLGAVGGQAPLSVLVQNTDWRSALQIVSLIGIVLGVIYLLIVRDKAVVTSELVPIKPQERTLLQLKRIFLSKQAWLLSFYSGLAFAPVSVFGGLWGVPFLQTAHRLSPTNAAFAVSWIFIGFAVGAPLFGWFSDYIERRKPILFVGTLIAFIMISIVLYAPQLSFTSICALLFMFGFGASGFFTCFAMIREIFPIVIAGMVLGIMNTFDSVCEALFEPFVGFLLDLTWSGKMQSGEPIFSTASYHLSLMVLPLALLISLILLTRIKETYCKSIEQSGPQQDDDSSQVAMTSFTPFPNA